MSAEYLQVPIRGRKLSYEVEISRRVHQRQTDFQQVEIVESLAYGRMLLLDGHIQLAELDEHAYHEALVHIPLVGISQPKSALVIGGGDGGVLRELCRYPSIERVDMAEIDAGVVEACREHMPSVSGGAFDDPRVHLHITDAFQFVKDTPHRYDLIVGDSTDVYEDEAGGLSEALFTADFYRDCRALLKPGGVMITQADNLVFCPYSTEGTRNAFAQIFPKVGIYMALVPSFGGFSGYCWGTVDGDVTPQWRDPGIPLRYLNEVTYRLAFEDLGFSLQR
jgi:spermidine synthase